MSRRPALLWVVGALILVVVALTILKGRALPQAVASSSNPATAATTAVKVEPDNTESVPVVVKPSPPSDWPAVVPTPHPDDPDAPMLLVQVHSLNRMFDDMKVLARVAGLSKQIDDVFKAFGPRGLLGIRANEPGGVYTYVRPGATKADLVGLIPVTSEGEFLILLSLLNCPADREGSGHFVVRSSQLPGPLRFRIADGYAYGTFGNPAALNDGSRIPPMQLFPRMIDGDLVATARFDRLPAPVRETLLSQMDGAATQVLAQMPGASKAQQDWARKIAESASTLTRDVFEGKGELSLRLEVDKTAGLFLADVRARGASGSRLDRKLAKLSPGISRFGGVIAGNPALAALLHVQLSNDYRGLLAELGRQATKQVLHEAGSNAWKEHEQLFKLLEDGLKAGELDVALAIRNHGDGKPGSIAAIKVPDGLALDKLFRDLVAKELKPEDRARFKLNADNIPGDKGARVHEFETKTLAREMPLFAPMLSGGPNLYGFSKDAVWMAGGTQGRETLRRALEDSSLPRTLFHFEMNAKSLAEIIPSEAAKLEDVRATLTEKNPGRVRLTLESGTDLHLSGRLDLTLVGLAARLAKVQVQFQVQPDKP